MKISKAKLIEKRDDLKSRLVKSEGDFYTSLFNAQSEIFKGTERDESKFDHFIDGSDEMIEHNHNLKDEIDKINRILSL